MPNVDGVDCKFQTFIQSIGLRKEIAAELWDADIRSPQELAGCDREVLCKVTNNQLLLNKFHPALQEHVYKIAMAKDPYKKAISIMQKFAGDSDDEAMDTGVSADSTSFVSAEVAEGQTSSIGNGRSNQAVNNSSGTRFNNNRMHMDVNDNSSVQSQIGFGKTTGKPNKGPTIMISGGNFVQSNVMGQGPVTYNNTNTTISTSLEQKMDGDPKATAIRRSQLLNSSLWIDGVRRRTADLQWRDRTDFWVNKIRVPTADYEEYSRHLVNEDVYPVRMRGKSRAIILNNIEFNRSSNMSRREGAQVDCERMETLVGNLGFGSVERHNDQTAADMLKLLENFAKHRDNMQADMVLVYIGSHGERDADGNDTFVGKDGTRITFNAVKEIFSPTKCPTLSGKPKIFFLQFCRQESNTAPPRTEPPARGMRSVQVSDVGCDSGAFVDANPPLPLLAEPKNDESETRHMDMLCVFATLAGTKAYRDTSDGSWFVTAIIRVFTEHAGKDDVLSMLTKVNNLVALNEGKEGQARAVQVSEVVHTLRKKIKFFPGEN